MVSRAAQEGVLAADSGTRTFLRDGSVEVDLSGWRIDAALGL